MEERAKHIKEQIAQLITDASEAIGKPMVEGVDFEMVYQPRGHTPLPLPDGKIAVYTFYYNDRFLKIGQANRNSQNRYRYQHYSANPNGARSTLAKSLIHDPTMCSVVDPEHITQWIKDNCERFDVILDGARHGKMTLNFVEGLLHYYFNPMYEN